MWTGRTLLITDDNLGDAAVARVGRIADDLTWLNWRIDGPEDRATALNTISRGRWDLAISIYSDLVLDNPALEAIGLPLNIHPALPAVRGMGYDIVPLAENHATVGATLHRMVSSVDSGDIFRVIEESPPDERSYGRLRAFNQALSLRMLDDLCALMVEAGDVGRLERRLREQGSDIRHRWAPTYHSRAAMAGLRSLYAANPDAIVPGNADMG